MVFAIETVPIDLIGLLWCIGIGVLILGGCLLVNNYWSLRDSWSDITRWFSDIFRWFRSLKKDVLEAVEAVELSRRRTRLRRLICLTRVSAWRMTSSREGGFYFGLFLIVAITVRVVFVSGWPLVLAVLTFFLFPAIGLDPHKGRPATSTTPTPPPAKSRVAGKPSPKSKT